MLDRELQEYLDQHRLLTDGLFDIVDLLVNTISEATSKDSYEDALRILNDGLYDAREQYDDLNKGYSDEIHTSH